MASSGCGKTSKSATGALKGRGLQPRRTSFLVTYGAAAKPCPFKTPTPRAFSATTSSRAVSRSQVVDARLKAGHLTIPKRRFIISSHVPANLDFHSGPAESQSLPRRPLQIPPPQQMHVQMKNRLPGARADVEHCAIAILDVALPRDIRRSKVAIAD